MIALISIASGKVLPRCTSIQASNKVTSQAKPDARKIWATTRINEPRLVMRQGTFRESCRERAEVVSTHRAESESGGSLPPQWASKANESLGSSEQ